jgi:endoribonuclease Dicer
MEQARDENLVVCLPTGSGKTYIAVMLIKEMAHAVRARVDDGGKRTVFLVNTGLSFNAHMHAPLQKLTLV